MALSALLGCVFTKTRRLKLCSMPKRIAKKLDVFRALVPAHLFKQIVGVVTGIVVDEI